MTKIGRFDGSDWWFAPWAGGAGGTYQCVTNSEVLGYLSLVIESPAAGEHHLVSLDEDDLPTDAKPLPIATKLLRGTRAIISVPGVPAHEVSEYPKRWIGNLADSEKVVLSVAAEQGKPVLVWLMDGGRAGWEQDREKSDRDKRQAKVRHALQERRNALKHAGRALDDNHRNGRHFVNPYTFVPLPTDVHRAPPRGHARLGSDGYSGWFDWRLCLHTDLLLPAEQPPIAGAHLDYPGSSLRGVLRSMHETIAGGCLRVINESYVPVHRDPMSAYRSATDRLAVVTKLDPMTRAVTEVELTEEAIWVQQGALRSGVPQGKALHSGFEIAITSDAKKNSDKRRLEVTDPRQVNPGKGWVVHLTSPAARKKGHPYYAAVGHKTGRYWKVPEKMWEAYVAACAGSADLLGARENGAGADTSDFSPGHTDWPKDPVESPKGTAIGDRRKVDGWLAVGDTVWLTGDWKTGGGALKMAVIWRSHGKHPVEERLDKANLPCQTPGSLCPSCAVFGSVNPKSGEAHEQDGYRTHVQVHWGRSETKVNTTKVRLPPLRSPKPTSGGFYLFTPEKADLTASPDERHIARSHWGSSLDPVHGEPRKIRGRKYYWHGQTDDQNGRHAAREHNSGRDGKPSQHGEALSAPAGTVIATRVTFENLSLEQLGWLLAAANPKLLFDTECRLHLGRGKPLGFGTVEPEIADLHLWTAASRYGVNAAANGGDARPAPTETLSGAMAAIRELAAERGLHETHFALERVLAPDTVPADRIWYPPTGSFTEKDAHMEEFDESFRWFGGNSGARRKRTDPEDHGKLVSLPDASSPDQYLAAAERKKR